MAEQRIQRKLAAIVSADVVGFSAMMGRDEAGTLARLKAMRAEVLDPKVAAFGGRIVKTTGDGALIEFASAVDAVAHAVDVQRGMDAHNAGVPDDQRIRLRQGINVGDVMIDGDDIYGDGVNVAARLEALAEPDGICISGRVHDYVDGRVDVAFEDLGLRRVKNIAAPVHVYRVVVGSGATAQSAEAPAPRAARGTDPPSIAVLPFSNLSGDPEQKYFSDGITDDIITELSRYDELVVIARQSTFAYEDRTADAGEIARELGVQYILQGAVRRADKRVRVSVQLVDTGAGNTVWADRYDRDLGDIFAVQDEIAGVIVNTLAGAVARQHFRRVMAKAPGATDAYDHALKAMELLWKVGPRENREARREAETAVTFDPGFARAHALIAWTHVSDGSNHWSDDPAVSFDLALEAARRAVEADDRDPWAHLALGWALIWRDRGHERALVALRRSIALNPGNAHFHSMYGWGLGWAGKAEDALHEMTLAKRLNPHHPVLYDIFLGRALFHLHRYDDALTHLEPAADAMAGHVNGLALLAACYAAARRSAEARDIIRSIRQTSPGYTLAYIRATMPYAHAADLDLFITMLEAAGLPE